MKLLTDYAKRITDPMFDVCGDTGLTPGQTLTVLEMAREIINIEIARWQETVERQTSPLACHLPGEDGSDRWKPGISNDFGYTDEGKGGID